MGIYIFLKIYWNAGYIEIMNNKDLNRQKLIKKLEISLSLEYI